MIGVRGVARTIDSDADSHRRYFASVALDQNACELPAAEQEIVRPFDRQFRLELGSQIRDGIMRRQRRDE